MVRKQRIHKRDSQPAHPPEFSILVVAFISLAGISFGRSRLAHAHSEPGSEIKNQEIENKSDMSLKFFLPLKQFSQSGLLLLAVVWLVGCNSSSEKNDQPVHKDVAFTQDFSKKYILQDNVQLRRVYSDRNGVIQISTSANLYQPHAGQFLYPGTLVKERYYRPIADKNIANVGLYRDHFVYVDDKAVLSNAWAGNLYVKHSVPKASLLAGGENFDFLISDGKTLQYLKDSLIVWTGQSPQAVRDIIFDPGRKRFLILSDKTISAFTPADQSLKPAFEGSGLTCFSLAENNSLLVVGTNDGYFKLATGTLQREGDIERKLPWTELTTVQEIDGNLWFGSTRGAFMLRGDGKFNYYASQRWIPSDSVVDIEKGPDHSILVLTDKGLGQLCFEKMTLQEKAAFFEKQVRNRHIRHGFNATLGYMTDGNVDTGSLEDSDNDGLWTTMYMGAELFRYKVTNSPEALQNLRESMEAMERLYTINGVKGFPSRSFERRGYKYDSKPWRRAEHPEWDWKSTTSSDEAIGHMFIFGAMAELLEGDLKDRAIIMMDSLMQHVIDNDMYLVDWDGKPTTWGRWNPEYVNARPVMVGDRKINGSNIVSMLQTAYHFTGKEVYKDKAFELMTKYGYYENLMRPMSGIGMAPDSADDWSKMLSESWNHSDDEMYFLGYWGLYRYAFNDTLKANFKDAIVDHWEIERPEKEAAWNIFTAITGVKDFDLEEAVWYLQEYPLDLVHWRVTNSYRKDITTIEPNFREQTITEVLPPDELPINRHNANRFELDGGDGGTSEYSAGDIWLLPYWMGRYLGVIAAPEGGK